MENATEPGSCGPDAGLEASAHTGKTLYRHVCRLLAASFGCRGVWIGTVEGPDAPELDVVAACDHGTAVESFPLSLAGSPCEPVLRDGQLVVPAGVHEQFPAAPQHQLRGSEAYAGRAIVDNGGRVRGLIALSDDRPFDDPEAVARLLEVFARRIGAEFVRDDDLAEIEHDRVFQRFLAEVSETLLAIDGAASALVEREPCAPGRHEIVDLTEFERVLAKTAERYQADRVALYKADNLAKSTCRLGVWTRSGRLPETAPVAPSVDRESVIELMLSARDGAPVHYREDDATLPASVRRFIAALGIPSCLVVPAAYETPSASDRWVGALVIGGPDPGRVFESFELAELGTLARIFAMAALRTEAEAGRERYSRLLREASVEMSITEERARLRMEAELHDDLAQDLAALKIELEKVRKDPAAKISREGLARAIDLTDTAIVKTREIITSETPVMLRELGLFRAIEWLTQRTASAAGLESDCRIATAVLTLPLDEPCRIMVFQVLRELLNNVRKHADASRLEVSCDAEEGWLVLSVADDGVGIGAMLPPGVDPMQVLSGRTRGFGLFSLKHRIGYFGGTMTVDSSADAGMRVEVRVPAQKQPSRRARVPD